MARPRSFDEDDVLDAAVDCFRKRGLEATSIRDLAAEMGINCPSLYNAFGDKRGLFTRALVHYSERFHRERLPVFEALASGKAAIRAFFDDYIDRALNDPGQHGCLIINSALDLAPEDAELRAIVEAHFARVEAFFRSRLALARAAGDTPASLPIDDAARLLLAAMLGLRVIARIHPDRDRLEGVARPVLALLDHPSAPA